MCPANSLLKTNFNFEHSASEIKILTNHLDSLSGQENMRIINLLLWYINYFPWTETVGYQWQNTCFMADRISRSRQQYNTGFKEEFRQMNVIVML